MMSSRCFRFVCYEDMQYEIAHFHNRSDAVVLALWPLLRAISNERRLTAWGVAESSENGRDTVRDVCTVVNGHVNYAHQEH